MDESAEVEPRRQSIRQRHLEPPRTCQAREVELVDDVPNGNGDPEALYRFGLDPLDPTPGGLRILGGATLRISNLPVYVCVEDTDTSCTDLRTLFGAMSTIAYDGGFLQLVIPTCAPGTDADSDSVCDPDDNCQLAVNPGQRDEDRDGYGNACDADFNNDGIVGAPDFATFGASFGQVFCDEDFDGIVDLNGDGAVGATDFAFFGTQYIQGFPGPSGLACAGTVPCP